jgi:23S rRNA (guanosine2251-2'-O)-methyltransferase
LPEHRHKPGDFSGGHKPGGKRFRPSGERPGGFRTDGPRFDGPRFDGPRPGGFQDRGPSSDGPRLDGPRQDGPRADGPIPYRGPGGQRSFGPRPGGRPSGPGGAGRPSGGPGYGSPRPGGFRSGQRPGGFRPDGPRQDGPRPGGFRQDGPRFDAPRPDFSGSAGEGQGGAPQAPRREWQPNNAWTPQPPRRGGPGGSGGFRPGPGGPRPGFGGPRPGYGPRPGFGGPRPGYGPRPGFQSRHPFGENPGVGEARPPEQSDLPREDTRRGSDFRPAPRPFARPGGFSGPRRSGPPGARPGFGHGPGPGPRRAGFGFGAERVERAESPSPWREPQDRGDENAEAPAERTEGTFDAAETTEASEASPARGSVPAFDRPQRAPRPSFRPDFRARSGGYTDRRPFGAGPSSAAPWARQPAGPPPSDLVGEGEELVAGRHPVEEAFIARRKAVRLLVVPQRRQALEKLVLHATNLRIPIVEVEGGTLTSLAGFDGHQGIALVTDKRQFAGLDDILARAIERKEAPFVLVLDSLEDPQNFGSLLRTAEASGVHGVIYPVRRQAPLSAAAVKASAGAVEHLLLVPVEDLAEALTDLHVRGLRIIGTDADAPLTARQADLRGPVVVVVGSEGQGLGPAVRRRCDAVVKIPMRGRVSSLNAAVAGSILLYEASSQRGGDRAVFQNPFAEPAGIDFEPVDEAAEPGAYVESEAPVAEDSAAAEVAAPTELIAEAIVEPKAPAPKAKASKAKDPKAKAPRRSAKVAALSETPIPETIESEEDALLPGSSAIDSSDAASAE